MNALFKSDREKDEYWRLSFTNPRHFCLVAAALALGHGICGVPGVVTSVHRTKEEQEAICARLGIKPYTSVHQIWRGTDLRVEFPSRDGAPGWPEDVAQEVCDILNGAFEYRRSDGTLSLVARVHGVGSDRHIHLQSPVHRQWRA